MNVMLVKDRGFQTHKYELCVAPKQKSTFRSSKSGLEILGGTESLTNMMGIAKSLFKDNDKALTSFQTASVIFVCVCFSVFVCSYCV